jgi:predicted RNA binding protein YcfA (HicA-like mRNA interferase family)
VSTWPSKKGREVLAALLRIGWRIKRTSGSHRVLSKTGYYDIVFAFRDPEDIGLMMFIRIARAAGLKVADLC